MNNKEIKNTIKEGYSNIAKRSGSCCSCQKKDAEKIAKEIGYSDGEIKTPGNLGLGCGNPIALGKINPGETVLDLGSGAGFDCFLASKKVGQSGKVIGIDMTEDMIEKAKINAEKYGYANVQFILGDIEKIPLQDSTVNVVISNCVINLAPDKSKVFKEAFRVLKNGGRMYLSDIVLLARLTKEQRADKRLLCGCVAGALQREEYLEKIREAGFNVNVLAEDKEISKKQYRGIALESIKIEAIKL